MKNVVLIGFMGSGKTSIGKALAAKLGRAFVDIDHAIETEEGMSVAAIFAQHGEAYFRECEKNACRKAAERRNLVIATGGGTVKDPDNLAVLKKTGLVVCLTANADTIMERTRRTGQRPILDAYGSDDVGRRRAIAELMEERRELYAKADYTLDTTDKTPLLVVEDLVKRLRARGI